LLRSERFERSTTLVNLPFLELPQLLPQVLDWVETQERYALGYGVSLSPTAAEDARAAGVSDPQQVRLCVVREIPPPDHPRIKQLAAELGLITPETLAITFGYGIFIREDHLDDRQTLVHECVHVAQYEKVGLEDFLMQYVVQIFKHGYDNAPMEREARAVTESVIGNR
jgi:hypothetical protein